MAAPGPSTGGDGQLTPPSAVMVHGSGEAWRFADQQADYHSVLMTLNGTPIEVAVVSLLGTAEFLVALPQAALTALAGLPEGEFFKSTTALLSALGDRSAESEELTGVLLGPLSAEFLSQSPLAQPDIIPEGALQFAPDGRLPYWDALRLGAVEYLEAFGIPVADEEADDLLRAAFESGVGEVAPAGVPSAGVAGPALRGRGRGRGGGRRSASATLSPPGVPPFVREGVMGQLAQAAAGAVGAVGRALSPGRLVGSAGAVAAALPATLRGRGAGRGRGGRGRSGAEPAAPPGIRIGSDDLLQELRGLRADFSGAIGQLDSRLGALEGRDARPPGPPPGAFMAREPSRQAPVRPAAAGQALLWGVPQPPPLVAPGASTAAAPCGPPPGLSALGVYRSAPGECAWPRDGLAPVPEALPGPTPTGDPVTDALQEVAITMRSMRGRGESAAAGGTGESANSIEELEALTLGSGTGAGADRLGAVQIERIRRTTEKRPDLIVLSLERETMRRLMVLPGESWSFSRHAREQVLPLAGGHHTLRKVIVGLAHLLDLARTESPTRVYAFATQFYKATQAAAAHPNKEWAYGWPLLGLDDPDTPARPIFSPTEHAALAAWHRDQSVIDRGAVPGLVGAGHAAPLRKGAGRGSCAPETPGGGDSEADSKLKAEVIKLRKDLQEAKKKGGKGGSKASPNADQA